MWLLCRCWGEGKHRAHGGCGWMDLMHGWKTPALEAEIPAPSPAPPICPCSFSFTSKPQIFPNQLKKLKISTLHPKRGFLEMNYVIIEIFFFKHSFKNRDFAKVENWFKVVGSVRWRGFRSVLACTFSHLGNMGENCSWDREWGNGRWNTSFIWRYTNLSMLDIFQKHKSVHIFI